MTDKLSPFRGEAGQLLARETIKELGVHSIPTSPENYELWTAHRTGVNPDLSREIEERLGRGETFTDETNQALLERYIANARLSVRMWRQAKALPASLPTWSPRFATPAPRLAATQRIADGHRAPGWRARSL